MSASRERSQHYAVAVSDPQSRPRDGDRKSAVEQVDQAYAEGRITAADRALRVGNIENAATLGELDVVVRDLKLEPGEVAPQMIPPPPIQPAPIQPSPPTPPQAAPSAPGQSLPPPPVSVQAGSAGAPQWTSETLRASSSSSGSGLRVVILAIVGLVVLVSVGAIFFVANVVGDVADDVTSATDPFEFTDPVEPQTLFPPSDDPTVEPSEPVDRLALTVAGLRWFVGRHEEQFGTTRTLGVTVWADRASIDRSVHGGRRLERWMYDDGEFVKFGSVTTNSRGTEVVDLRNLRLKPLVANIARAKRTLNVEKPETIYVIIGDDSLGGGPEARIYVSNQYNESGYMATTFGGRVVRSYPFQR